MWQPKQQKLEPTQCPVCRTILGKRDCDTVFAAHCEECKATFYWRPWEKKPTVIRDADKPIVCGCGNCGR